MDLRNTRIKLDERTWILDTEIAEGGAGIIYAAQDERGVPAVVKLVLKIPRAYRELLFESLPPHSNIMPIWDKGEWDNYYVLVMPRAEKSLRQHMEEVGGKLYLDEGIKILIDITEALSALNRDVVHRDLKPENILLYQGRWCLADFGIARYAEATTAPETQKYLFTVGYAAPEQWRHEHATPATDVYAFGVTAFELLQGRKPFLGPDLRDQHLHQEPPALVGCGPSLALLISECLTKAPQARPTPANILMRLHKSQQPSSPAVASLQAANQQVIARQVREETAASVQKTLEDQRRDLLEAARRSFEPIVEELIERIQDAASAATLTRTPNLTVQFGDGILRIGPIQSVPSNCLAIFDRPAPFDVIAATTIEIHQPSNWYHYEGRSHSLWYCDAHEQGVYRWFETAFTISPLIAKISTINPFALAPNEKNAAMAFSPTLAEYQVAWEPLPFDQGDEEQFLSRWMQWLAGAVNGGLQNPSRMPENSGGHHRRPA